MSVDRRGFGTSDSAHRSGAGGRSQGWALTIKSACSWVQNVGEEMIQSLSIVSGHVCRNLAQTLFRRTNGLTLVFTSYTHRCALLLWRLVRIGWIKASNCWKPATRLSFLGSLRTDDWNGMSVINRCIKPSITNCPFFLSDGADHDILATLIDNWQWQLTIQSFELWILLLSCHAFIAYLPIRKILSFNNYSIIMKILNWIPSCIRTEVHKPRP